MSTATEITGIICITIILLAYIAGLCGKSFITINFAKTEKENTDEKKRKSDN